mmetsp:Transcript_35227/g.83136  ORF Transcript_35227/g.83136 Transcript_35227/m.83136 type:complete len:217 (-) Transcript_35227:234-884(-)
MNACAPLASASTAAGVFAQEAKRPTGAASGVRGPSSGPPSEEAESLQPPSKARTRACASATRSSTLTRSSTAISPAPHCAAAAAPAASASASQDSNSARVSRAPPDRLLTGACASSASCAVAPASTASTFSTASSSSRVIGTLMKLEGERAVASSRVIGILRKPEGVLDRQSEGEGASASASTASVVGGSEAVGCRPAEGPLSCWRERCGRGGVRL